MSTASVRTPRSRSAHSHGPIRLRDLAQALDHSDEGFALTDPEGNYVYLNGAHLRIYGYERPQELLGRSWRTLYDTGWTGHLEHSILPLLPRDKVWRGRVIGRRRDGSSFPAAVTLTLLPDGKITCNCRDESPNGTAAPLLDGRQNAMQAVGEHVISGLPGRLRKPLDTVAGYTGFFLAELDAGRDVPLDTLRNGLAEIEFAGRRLASQMQRLDMLARAATAGDVPAEEAGGGWPSQLEASARRLAESSGRHADLVLDISPADLAMDYCPLEFVLLEILGNAFQCSRPGDAVLVTGCTVDNTYELKVCDDGIGLPSGGIHPSQGRSVGQETPGGFGLAVVSCILGRFGGDLDLGKGDSCTTCCRLALPLRGK